MAQPLESGAKGMVSKKKFMEFSIVEGMDGKVDIFINDILWNGNDLKMDLNTKYFWRIPTLGTPIGKFH